MVFSTTHVNKQLNLLLHACSNIQKVVIIGENMIRENQINNIITIIFY